MAMAMPTMHHDCNGGKDSGSAVGGGGGRQKRLYLNKDRFLFFSMILKIPIFYNVREPTSLDSHLSPQKITFFLAGNRLAKCESESHP